MKQDNMPQVARFWNAIADEFDSIYTGANKSAFSRFLDRYAEVDGAPVPRDSRPLRLS